ncbi:SAM-dependent methyltransferase [Bacillus sp. Xin]|uniref:SAM-dependent methyltransferase n=1 Tax=unclassified Bacillus (in: firmicutes) TaxID=185979 RepID=UPI0015726839|nr:MULTISPECIES: SAM-dependent methyltransferase [unclassified Bacillus (in: firmicutes)]MBC6975844.1 SAM-dependent methyltransferase [Bacillus sp. Xin]NSW35153.1 SAM-dependent methyltransferase [Bacillus sp. Xin1]
MLKSKIVGESDYNESWFTKALTKLREPFFLYMEQMPLPFNNTIYHRKLWEWCYIYQALLERNMLIPFKKGLGFGVGKEPLASLFAFHGCYITATDLDYSQAVVQGWVDTNQHSQQIMDLCQYELCDPNTLRHLASFETVDMNCIPDHLNDLYDFTWSSCSFEHCGSIELGFQFILNQMKCLKPGGVAIHTTEYNLSSNDDTIESGITVIFRKKDIEQMVAALRAEGHLVDIDYSIGSGNIESYVDIPPYKQDPHLRLQLAQYVSTSIGLIIQKDK